MGKYMILKTLIKEIQKYNGYYKWYNLKKDLSFSYFNHLLDHRNATF